MEKELKEKLNNLSGKFNTELDIISLKALCNMPKSEEISFAITGTLNRLIEKYPDDNEILGLLPKKEKISLEELIKLLEEKYSGNVEVITIKALSALPEGETKENAVKQCLERLLQVNADDEDIMEYLGISEKSLVKETVKKEQNPNMIFVEGGSYIPSFFNEERKVVDLYVSKYQTTQEEWENLEKINPSEFKGKRLPVTNITWWDTLEYCNKLSECYGLKPVYSIEINRNEKNLKINQLDGKKVYPNLADFSKTEGYRLPTELEWEWFARGGKVAQEKGTFDTKYAGDESYEKVAWLGEKLRSDDTTLFYGNSQNKLHDIGLLKPNELKLYDLSGNVDEFCYDSYFESRENNIYLDEKNSYYYNSTDNESVIRGGNFKDDEKTKRSDEPAAQFAGIFLSTLSIFQIRPSNTITDCNSSRKDEGNLTTGFRVVRTANPQK